MVFVVGSLQSPTTRAEGSALFGQICPLMSRAGRAYCLCMATAKTQSEHDAILKTLQLYIDGCRQGNSELMRPAFHAQASFFGYAGDQLAVGLGFLFDWIERNGPAPDIESRVVSVDMAESIAVVRLEVANWSGKLAGSASACRISLHFSGCRRAGGSSRKLFTGIPKRRPAGESYCIVSG